MTGKLEKLEIKDIAQDLDLYCQKIMLVLASETKKEVGFNELAKTVEKFFKMSKPTLSEHLKHLIKHKVVKKRVAKNSSLNLKPSYYSLNWQVVRKEIPKEIIRKFEQWKKLSVYEIAETLFDLLIFADLRISRLLIEEQVFKNSDIRAEIWITRHQMLNLQNLFLNIIMKKLQELSREELSNFLTEFDKELERIVKSLNF